MDRTTARGQRWRQEQDADGAIDRLARIAWLRGSSDLHPEWKPRIYVAHLDQVDSSQPDRECDRAVVRVSAERSSADGGLVSLRDREQPLHQRRGGSGDAPFLLS